MLLTSHFLSFQLSLLKSLPVRSLFQEENDALKKEAGRKINFSSFISAIQMQAEQKNWEKFILSFTVAKARFLELFLISAKNFTQLCYRQSKNPKYEISLIIWHLLQSKQILTEALATSEEEGKLPGNETTPEASH